MEICSRYGAGSLRRLEDPQGGSPGEMAGVDLGMFCGMVSSRDGLADAKGQWQ